MKIFMVIVDKCPNTQTGVMGGVPLLVGEIYSIPGKGRIKLLDIQEGISRNKKPCITLVHENNIIIEMPDYNIDKFRDYGQVNPETDDKSKKHQ